VAIERAHHLAIGADALGDLQAAPAEDVGLPIVYRVITRPRLATFLERERMPEAHGGQEGSARGALGHHRIGRVGRAVDEGGCLAEQGGEGEAEMAATTTSAAPMPQTMRSCVVSALPMGNCPSGVSTTTSVKVPPVSTKMRKVIGSPGCDW
jgi:hypothetical protein